MPYSAAVEAFTCNTGYRSVSRAMFSIFFSTWLSDWANGIKINNTFMYPEARKIHLIEAMLKVKSEAILIALESVLRRAGLYKEKNNLRRTIL